MRSFPNHRATALEVVFTILVSVSLTYLFWPGLWHGGGLVGGDIYSYFFPQKQFLADSLRSGEFPYWNNLTGHGYPLIGESQTGAFYPFHWLYAACDLNSAYNFIQLVHYGLAFFWCWLLLRRWGSGMVAAWVGSVSFTYGWLPARICNEWAALGACWLPAVLWSGESFFVTAKWRYLVALSGIVGLQMLPGHFHLAFITQVTLLGYLILRLFLFPQGIAPEVIASRSNTLGMFALALACGFGLAAVQLLPTWELKQLSQRAGLGVDHDPGFGFIPLWYFGQLVAPWSYYVPDVVLGVANDGARTNVVEAHLYCGLLPLALIVIWLFSFRSKGDPRNRIWLILGMAALIYSSGYLMPVARYFPGFGFFNGVGRMGIVVNLAVAALAASSLDQLLITRLRRHGKWFGLVCLAGITLDTYWVAGMLQQTAILKKPPLAYREQSPFRKRLLEETSPVRLFCRGANVPNLLGVASTPVYLGLGPSAYFDPNLALPQPLPFDVSPTPEQLQWLRQAGVTHILSFQELDTAVWPVTHRLSQPDPFLNRVWARGNEPLHLYALNGSRGRVAWIEPDAGASAKVVKYQANLVRIEAESPSGGTLILTDLDWPGWFVRLDGNPVEQVTLTGTDSQFRSVSIPGGKHEVTWHYRPTTVWIGAGLSLISVLFLAAVAHIAFWHPQICHKILPRSG